MGASKTHQYSSSEINTALIARAIAHPARIRILNQISKGRNLRNIDLVSELQLVKSTVHKHILILKEADLIELDYLPNCYIIRLKEDNLDKLQFFIDHLN